MPLHIDNPKNLPTYETPTRSPWGTIDGITVLAPGIISVSTPSHGGLKLDSVRNAKMPKEHRRRGGWYEEDCEWALVAVLFPEEFRDEAEGARKTVRNWFPEAYTAITGDPVKLEESRVLQERAFAEETKNRFVAAAAWGDWHDRVPLGHVGLAARKASTNETRYFLVKTEEYKKNGVFQYVVPEGADPWGGPNPGSSAENMRAP